MIGTVNRRTSNLGGLFDCQMSAADKADKITEALLRTGAATSPEELARLPSTVAQLEEQVEADCRRERRRKFWGILALVALAIGAGAAATKRRKNSGKKERRDFIAKNAWRAAAVVVGLPMILIPEPATTALGAGLVGGALLIPQK
jgi:hypothetical protein